MKINEYCLGEITVFYLITEEGRTSMVLLPDSRKDELAENWKEWSLPFSAGDDYKKEWNCGSLVQLHLGHHCRSCVSGATMKYSQSTEQLHFKEQREEHRESQVRIITVLEAEEGYRVVHTLTWEVGMDALWCEIEFINIGDKILELEMLTSFCLENLSPLQKDNDQTDVLNLHRFRAGWALEGLHREESIESLGLQKSWCTPFPKCEKFGSIGSWPTGKFFPTAAVEDKENHVIWAANLEHNSSWQMELTRDGDTVSLSGGIADVETGAWMKRVAPGEHFCAPRAGITVVDGDIYEACQRLIKLQNTAADAYGEKGLPVLFNEYCTTWGNPTQAKIMEIAKLLLGKGIRYLVIDAGWSKDGREQLGNGEWFVDTNRFPDMKAMNRSLREMGYVPGVWFEMEVTTEGSPVYEEEYDDMHLKRNGVVIHTGTWRTYWDFTNPQVIEYLTEHVIGMLKEYDFGYMKVDYNGNIGIGCDGAESFGEGLRRQMEGVREFFKKIKQEIPNIIIENCASGGNRSEASMFGVTAMTSFSDAHEAKEIPYIAANLQSLVLPRQNQIWAVLRKQDTVKRLQYSIASGFMGRLCLSGDIENLSEEQWREVTGGIRFYQNLEHILMNGTTKIYGARSPYMRHPKGTQAVVRENGSEMLVVCHGFERTDDKICIPLKEGLVPVARYGQQIFHTEDGLLVINKMNEWTAGAIYLRISGC